ncbi:aminoglycoside phosphotransferase family protein [Ruania alba]|uniref:Phosphotransferase enzyme family protein n=1 Tax=Ruania alba TaxID=648782 RepID=A0A1H5KJA9_9MICO|nr:aminoglycoside phosphotransferase family protein [Ruania alba]SEE64875.1 Phosphotransferase enzyme family protein [Ruania alba]
MRDHPLARLTSAQRALLAAWLPGLTILADLSWELVETTVLHASTADGTQVVIKAGGPSDHHIEREIRAHRQWTTPWTATGHASRLLHGDSEAKLLVTTYLTGRLVLETPDEDDPEVYRLAGELLTAFHGQAELIDHDWERRENAKSLAWLDRPHRVDPAHEAVLRLAIATWPTPSATLVPTHGDWQPRNWLIDGTEVRVIDFGRAAWRPASTDLARLAARNFSWDPALEHAFFSGYGTDPREPESWLRCRVREAIGTAAWAYQVGDRGFEAEGHHMIERVVPLLHEMG